ncbi:MAG TPA: hypothetical protein VH437_12745 [Terriglobales bacterium]|jgi:hypothetical protein
MKKTGLFLLLVVGIAAYAQQADSNPPETTPSGTVFSSASFPMERIQTPTPADMYCAGFISRDLVPNANFIAGGLHTPNTTKFVNGDLIYLSGTAYQAGQQYTILRELRDPNQYELFAGQHHMINEAGQPYSELARVRIIDTRSKSAVAQVEFSCDPINPGDIAVPFVEKPAITFRPAIRFDRFAPSNGKLSGRIIMAKDFDSEIGTGAKVYLNVGASQGVKAGDYFRTFRPYDSDLHDDVDSLSFKASTSEDTQKYLPAIEPKMFTTTKGAVIHVADLPRRALGEVVIISTTQTTATGMVVFSLEDIHVGDNVEMDSQE